MGMGLPREKGISRMGSYLLTPIIFDLHVGEEGILHMERMGILGPPPWPHQGACFYLSHALPKP